MSEQTTAIVKATLTEAANTIVAQHKDHIAETLAYARDYRCTDERTEGFGHAAIGEIKRRLAEANKQRLALVTPLKDVTSEIDRQFRESVTHPLDDAAATIESAIKPYAAETMRKKREAEEAAQRKLDDERRAREQAEREAREAQERAEKAEREAAEAKARAARAEEEAGSDEEWKRADNDARDAEARAKAERDAQAEAVTRAEQARAAEHGAAVDLFTSRREPPRVEVVGATAGYKTRRVATITEPANVPVIYWRPSLEAIQAAVDGGAREIPGVEIKDEVVIAHRRKAGGVA